MSEESLRSNPAPSIASRLTEIARRFEGRIETVNLPVHRASTVLFDSLEAAAATAAATTAGERGASTYGTAGTPTTYALMDALAELEGGGVPCRAALAPSGLTAIATAILAFVQTGDHLLMSDAVYGPSRLLAQGLLARMGVETTFYDPRIGAGIAELIRPNTRIVYCESPGSYTFEVQDVPAICRVARERGVIGMVDNAWASPMFSRPFDWGADVSLLPLTKYWSGHADVLMGAMVVREALWPALWTAVRALGVCVGGDDAYLILRGHAHDRRAHAPARVERAHRRTLARAPPGGGARAAPGARVAPGSRTVEARFQRVEWLVLVRAQRAGLRDGDDALAQRKLAALCDRRRCFHIGYSWGGFESLIMPAKIYAMRTAVRWTGGPLVRLHVGLEDPADLISDLEAGFAAMRAVA